MVRGHVLSGLRCTGEAQAAQATFAGFMVVLTVDVMQLVMLRIGYVRRARIVAVHIRDVGVDRSTQEQLQNQQHQNGRACNTHNVAEYALDWAYASEGLYTTGWIAINS